MMQLMAIFGSVGRGPTVSVMVDGCVVEGDPYGIASGWFNHPFNFDPVWLNSCTGFKSKTDA